MRLARASAPCSARKLKTASGMYYVSANVIPAAGPCKWPGALGEGGFDADLRGWARIAQEQGMGPRTDPSVAAFAIRPLCSGHPPQGVVAADEVVIQGSGHVQADQPVEGGADQLVDVLELVRQCLVGGQQGGDGDLGEGDQQLLAVHPGRGQAQQGLN